MEIFTLIGVIVVVYWLCVVAIGLPMLWRDRQHMERVGFLHWKRKEGE